MQQAQYVNMNELATMAAQKQKEVEMRRQQQEYNVEMRSAEARQQAAGAIDNRATVDGIGILTQAQHASRNQRSMSMPAATEVSIFSLKMTIEDSDPCDNLLFNSFYTACYCNDYHTGALIF